MVRGIHHATISTGDLERSLRFYRDHGITHICLDVTDIDEEYERLKAAGMLFHCPPQDVGDGVRCTYGCDPDGNIVEIVEVSNPRSVWSLKSE